MGEVTNVIRGVPQTEKVTRIQRMGQYVLDVAVDANKRQIKEAVERHFNVSVLKVNTLVYQGKWRRLTGRWGRKSERKRAIVTLGKGQSIEVK